ncbi:hypothetical protein M8C13_04465 [Crossiella sp. SN42]|uniref:hypothetical protein n=1 Tax=Crossiella sp. SN42 TaxID=2944808 RepID=UPI00207D09C4|nr:hypothetical protein [Crossiella sp. SN42]MCO1575012.1 hypothetical protein [Crossiella sp. SN42]
MQTDDDPDLPRHHWPRDRLYREAARRLREQAQRCQRDPLGPVQWEAHLGAHPALAAPLADWLDGAAAAAAKHTAYDARFVPPTQLAHAVLDWVPVSAEARIAAQEPPLPGPRR